MNEVVFHLEDVIFEAKAPEPRVMLSVPEDPRWRCKVRWRTKEAKEALSGLPVDLQVALDGHGHLGEHEFRLTDVQLGALLALAAGIGESPERGGLSERELGEVVQRLYHVVDPVLKGIPDDGRPVP